MACLLPKRRENDKAQGTSLWEFGVQGFRPDDKATADSPAAAVLAWDHELRGQATPRLMVIPAGTPYYALPAKDVVEKSDGRIVVSWPGRDEAFGHTVERNTGQGTVDEQ
ncbi:hypothetical protein ACFXPT_38380 [Streptomyces goshikiensis]|uniref:hypothetical protein n=1 Tax=Streptomyces goshikiensis TaxID=1942 RepID=UPI003677EF46